MKNRAFTLIELLVVVLIIGVLSAIALPQYEKAIEKAKATQAQVVLKSLSQTVQAYYLANGEYPTKFDELDVDMSSWTGSTKIHVWNITNTKSNNDWSLQIWSGNPGKNIMIMALRTAGAYKGAGFVIDSGAADPLTVHCVEDFSSVFPYSKAGAYCKKIFGGTDLDPTNSFRQYSLP